MPSEGEEGVTMLGLDQSPKTGVLETSARHVGSPCGCQCVGETVRSLPVPAGRSDWPLVPPYGGEQTPPTDLRRTGCPCLAPDAEQEEGSTF